MPDGTNSGDTVGAFIFTPPVGVTVLADPPGCAAHGGEEEDGGTTPKTWRCNGPGAVFPAGTSKTATFDLRIDSVGGSAGRSSRPVATRGWTTTRATTSRRSR
ncbi:hypothetical protein NKG94_33680 [Micromonospora sp. M12]